MFKKEDIALVLKKHISKKLKKLTKIKILEYDEEGSTEHEKSRYMRYENSFEINFKISHTVLRSKWYDIDLKEELNMCLEKPLNLTYYNDIYMNYRIRDDFAIKGIHFLGHNRLSVNTNRQNIHYIKFIVTFYEYEGSTIEEDFKKAIREVKMSQLKI